VETGSWNFDMISASPFKRKKGRGKKKQGSKYQKIKGQIKLNDKPLKRQAQTESPKSTPVSVYISLEN